MKKTDGTARRQRCVPCNCSIASSSSHRVTGIDKLEDANFAGGRTGKDCTLILTEGDSAKTLAVSGIAAVSGGRNYYGVFPLRGKLLNVRDASHTQIMDNAEIQALRQILGLVHGKKYTSVDQLRYGSIMIMTDQVGFPVSGIIRSEYFQGSGWFSHQRTPYKFFRCSLSFSLDATWLFA